MKRYLISTAVILAFAWITFGQEQSDWAQRWARYREAQGKAIAAIQEQAEKLKAAMEEAPRPDARRWQDLSEEERNQRVERLMKMRELWQKTLETIEREVVRLKGPRQLRTEHEESIDELKKIQELAKKENADETAKHVGELIAERQKEYEATVEKLGFGQFRPRR